MDSAAILINQAKAIAAKFGGQRKLARALGHSNPTTVSRWVKAGFIRPEHYPAILKAAEGQGVKLTQNDFALIKVEAF